MLHHEIHFASLLFKCKNLTASKKDDENCYKTKNGEKISFLEF